MSRRDTDLKVSYGIMMALCATLLIQAACIVSLGVSEVVAFILGILAVCGFCLYYGGLRHDIRERDAVELGLKDEGEFFMSPSSFIDYSK